MHTGIMILNVFAAIWAFVGLAAMPAPWWTYGRPGNIVSGPRGLVLEETRQTPRPGRSRVSADWAFGWCLERSRGGSDLPSC